MAENGTVLLAVRAAAAHRQVFSGTIATLAISLAFCLLPWATTFATLTAVAALAGGGNGVSSGLVMTLGADTAPLEGHGRSEVTFLHGAKYCGW